MERDGFVSFLVKRLFAEVVYKLWSKGPYEIPLYPKPE